MSWSKSVYSSHVQSIGYDSDAREMTVTWQNGKVSVYEDVPEETALQAANAPSVGQFLHSEIKSSFRHRYV